MVLVVLDPRFDPIFLPLEGPEDFTLAVHENLSDRVEHFLVFGVHFLGDLQQVLALLEGSADLLRLVLYVLVLVALLH